MFDQQNTQKQQNLWNAKIALSEKKNISWVLMLYSILGALHNVVGAFLVMFSANSMLINV